MAGSKIQLMYEFTCPVCGKPISHQSEMELPLSGKAIKPQCGHCGSFITVEFCSGKDGYLIMESTCIRLSPREAGKTEFV
ncbi:MAG: hypothetical protein PHC97_04415 [Patescibacteria group bacterium]|nr:hypothetical protein [Patescibacteria group bacterium]